MRLPKYISPTSLSLFYSSRDEFYLKYMADQRPPRRPQTEPMSVGSAFDAFAKAYISEKLFGEIREGFEREALFETQVAEHNRDFAYPAGEWVFQAYKKSGALADLMLELNLASEEPRFEFDVKANIPIEGSIDGMILMGKPDLYFKTKSGARVIYDWKVNGYCSKSGASPKSGYVSIRDGWGHEYAPKSRSGNSMHKTCQPMTVSDIVINVGKYFETVDKSWANQLSIYGWVLGEDVGSPLIIGIEQLACKPHPAGSATMKPLVRVASHRGYVSPKYQTELYEKAAYMWKAIHSGHIFDDLSRDENDRRCKTLDNQYRAYEGDSDNDKWFQQMTRKH
jgi:hypothetical protein